MKKSTSLAAAALVAAASIAYAAPSTASGSNHLVKAVSHVSDPRGDVSGPDDGHARVDVTRVVYTLGHADGFRGKAFAVRVRFAGEASDTARIRDTIRVAMTSGRRAFLLVAKPLRAHGAPGGFLPELNLWEVFDDGSRSPVELGRASYSPQGDHVKITFGASAFTHVGVSSLDTLRTTVAQADRTARDRTAAAEKLPLR